MLSNLKYLFTKEWWIYHSPIYIDLGFHKLWKDYNEVKKQMTAKPRLVFYKGDMGNDNWCEYYMDIHANYKDYINKWFAINVEPMGWKSVFGESQWQYCPEITIVIFKKLRYTIRLEAPKGTENENFWWVVMWLQSRKKD